MNCASIGGIDDMEFLAIAYLTTYKRSALTEAGAAAAGNCEEGWGYSG